MSDWTVLRAGEPGLSAHSITLADVPDPAVYRPAPGTIPDSPGVYRFRDPAGRVIYVGKAKSLRQRLNSYFADVGGLHPRTAQMVTSAGGVEWTVVSTEVEALQLEYNWIKEFDPRFNVRYRDDKSYPELAVTVGEEYPRLQVMRGPHRKGVRYFGPYAHAWAIRETLDLLLRVFPARTCSAGVFRRSEQIGRPCLLGYIGKCSAPCVGRVTAGRAPGDRRRVLRLHGRQGRPADPPAGEGDGRGGRQSSTSRRRPGCATTSARCAGRWRSRRWCSATAPTPTWSASRPTTCWPRCRSSMSGAAGCAASAAGSSTWTPTAPGPAGLPSLVENFLLQFYGGRADDDGATAVPREILVPVLPSQEAATEAELTDWLSDLRGSRVSLRVAQRGDKRALAETVTRNAAEALAQHRLKRASDLTARSAALTELADTLGMDVPPLRIECIDISHVQGTDVVASLVVFEDGLPKRSDYRRFAIRDRPGDDVASIAEVVRRRFTHGTRTGGQPADELAGLPAPASLAGERDAGTARPDRSTAVRRRTIDGTAGEPIPGDPEPTYRRGIDPDTGRPRRFAYPPQLLVVDGGAPQVNAAAAVLAELGIVDVTVCGLAKRLEEVWVPGQTTRSSSPGPVRRCTCCNGSATRRTGSRSPTTGRNGPSR